MRAVLPPRASILTGWTAVFVAATLLGGCAAGSPTSATGGSTTVSTPRSSSGTDTADDTPASPSAQPTSSPTGTGGSCPAQPLAKGPADTLVVVAISGPTSAASGSTVTVSSQLVVLSDGSRIVLTAQGSSLEVLRGSSVVARTPTPAGADVPLPLRAGASYPGQTLPTQVTLVGCDGTPLPPGTYGLRAVVAYGGDPLNNANGSAGGSGRFVFVSDPPVELTVT